MSGTTTDTMTDRGNAGNRLSDATERAARAERTEHEVLMSLGFPAARPGDGAPTRHGGRARREKPEETLLRAFASDERGAVTAEYTLVIVAAIAFAGALIALMRSDEVRAMLATLLQNALGSAG